MGKRSIDFVFDELEDVEVLERLSVNKLSTLWLSVRCFTFRGIKGERGSLRKFSLGRQGGGGNLLGVC